MKGGRYRRFLGAWLLTSAALLIGCSASAPRHDGAGPKRDPAPVMGWQGAGWLERDDREVEEKPEALLMSVEQVPAEWQPAGFELVERFDSMPSQHVFVFRAAPRAGETR